MKFVIFFSPLSSSPLAPESFGDEISKSRLSRHSGQIHISRVLQAERQPLGRDDRLFATIDPKWTLSVKVASVSALSEASTASQAYTGIILEKVTTSERSSGPVMRGTWSRDSSMDHSVGRFNGYGKSKTYFRLSHRAIFDLEKHPSSSSVPSYLGLRVRVNKIYAKVVRFV